MVMVRNSKILVIGFCVLAVLALLFIRNEGHALERGHTEAGTIRQLYKADLCDGVELWFAPLRGTILILCGVPESNQWGGMIIRFTENAGQTVLWHEAYECSAFVAKRSYWNRVIKRDGYWPLVNYPDIERAFRGWYQ